jgi:hypothetical protein
LEGNKNPIKAMETEQKPKRRKSSPKGGRPVKVQTGIAASSPEGIMPLDFMLAVIRDPTAGTTRRDRMAIAAAPYCHPRVTEVAPGKKQRAAQKAVDVDAALVAELEQEAANQNAVH